ncbi:MAG: hypothetical protein V4466_06525 [Pseudomonadota bacterium]
MISRPIRIAVFVAACAVVLWLSLAPTTAIPTVNLWDKVEHAVAYLGLALIGAATFPTRLGRLAGGLFLLGIGVEVLQATMNLGRQGDPLDALANSLGIAAGVGLALAIRDVVKVKSRPAGE